MNIPYQILRFSKKPVPASCYTPNHRSITMSASLTDEPAGAKPNPIIKKSHSVCLKVSDQGCGISFQVYLHISFRNFSDNKRQADL